MRYREYRRLGEIETRLYIEHPRRPGVYLPMHRRPMRLPEVDYRSPECLCFVTFNLHPQCPLTLTGELAEMAWQRFWETLRNLGCKVYAACLMPDHVHLLVAPSGKGESISDIVKRIKGNLCAAIRNQFGENLRWQASFYDHVLRQGEKQAEEFDAIVGYIYANPEQAGLGEGYPFRFRAT